MTKVSFLSTCLLSPLNRFLYVLVRKSNIEPRARNSDVCKFQQVAQFLDKKR